MNEKLYLMVNTSESWLPEHDELLKYVSPSRQQKIERYKSEPAKVTSLYAALLTRLGIVRLLGCDNSSLKFIYEDYKKPILDAACFPGADAVDFNFSHTDGAVLAGITMGESIGVDIEKIKKAPLGVMRLTFHPQEADYINSLSGYDRDRAFFEIWTKKEAYTKCIGTGLTKDFKTINTLDAPINSLVKTWAYDEYVFSVCIIPV